MMLTSGLLTSAWLGVTSQPLLCVPTPASTLGPTVGKGGPALAARPRELTEAKPSD